MAIVHALRHSQFVWWRRAPTRPCAGRAPSPPHTFSCSTYLSVVEVVEAAIFQIGKTWKTLFCPRLCDHTKHPTNKRDTACGRRRGRTSRGYNAGGGIPSERRFFGRQRGVHEVLPSEHEATKQRDGRCFVCAVRQDRRGRPGRGGADLHRSAGPEVEVPQAHTGPELQRCA